MAGTPNPDFDAEPWCTEEPATPEVVYVQESTDPGFRPETTSKPNQ